MNKHVFLIASLAGLGMAPLVGHAQVTLYGIVDTYITAVRSNGHTRSGVENGGLQISRFGLTGAEDLGRGVKANFRLENGFNTDTGTASNAAATFGRQAWAGFSHDTFGETRFGLQNSIFFNMLGNLGAFYGGTYGTGLGAQSGYNFRNANDMAYITPRWAGWKGEFHYALGESTTSRSEGNVAQVAAEYKEGPWYFLAGYVEQNLTAVAPARYNGDKLRQLALGGSYNFDPITLYLGYFRSKRTDGAIDKDLYSLSAAWQIDAANQLSVGWTVIDPKADLANVDPATFDGSGRANHYAITLFHKLSKRTTIYASGAWIDNDKGLRYAMGGAQQPSAGVLNRPDPGTATRGVQLGIRHVF